MANRPNRHSNPSKYGKKRNGRFIFIRNRNRKVKEMLKALP